MKKQIIFFTFFSLYQCQILTPEEDAERASKCGKVMQTKVLAGMSAEESAPWTLRVTVKSGDKSTPDPFFSSILVSDRHVLTAGLSVIVGRRETAYKKWEWIANKNDFQFEKCTNKRMDLPEEILKSMRVQLSLCQDVDKCGTKISRAVTKGYYLGSCESGLQPFGMVLLEMSLAVPFEEPFYFVPACVYSTGAHEDDDVVFHTAGAPIGNKKNELIKATETKVIECKSWQFDHSICANHQSCSGDFGGGLIRTIVGQSTVIGISYGADDSNCAPKDTDHLVKVGHFAKDLCSLAGICKTEPPYDPDHAATQDALHAIFKFFGVFSLFIL